MTTHSAAPKIELLPPDISAYRAGNTGIDYFTTFEATAPGPHVALTAVVHGNELCGALALDFLFRHDVRPKQGKLTLGFVNHAAFHSFDADNPTASRYVDEDINRLWRADVLDGARDSAELRRAREIRPLIDTVDCLLDIHSMQTSVAPLMMAGPATKGRELAAAVGIPEIIVCDGGHAAGKRMRDYMGFADPASAKNALLVECGQHWERESEAVALQTALRFLLHLGVVDEDFAGPHLDPHEAPRQKCIEVTGPVTIETDDFHFVDDYRGLETIENAGTVIGHDGDKPVATPYDDCVLIMPSRRLRRGESAVRLGRFIDF